MGLRMGVNNIVRDGVKINFQLKVFSLLVFLSIIIRKYRADSAQNARYFFAQRLDFEYSMLIFVYVLKKVFL